jgi:hypothetical protein
MRLLMPHFWRKYVPAGDCNECRLASRRDVSDFYAGVSAKLAESRDAMLAHLDRGLRRMVLALSAVLVASAAVVVLVTWSAS